MAQVLCSFPSGAVLLLSLERYQEGSARVEIVIWGQFVMSRFFQALCNKHRSRQEDTDIEEEHLGQWGLTGQ